MRIQVMGWPNKTAPTRSVNSAVNELSTPASPLASRVSAMANRKAGKKLPSSPVPSKNFQRLDSTLRRFLIANGNNAAHAMTMRKAPTSSEAYTTNPFLMSINEVPQMSASMVTRTQAIAGVEVSCAAGVVAVLIVGKLEG